MKSRDEGYVSAGVLILVLFLSTCALAVFYLSRTAFMQYDRMEENYALDNELEKVVFALIGEMEKDITPQADSSYDTVWRWLRNHGFSGVDLTLEDISSRFNLNFLRTKMLDNSDFSTMMTNGHSPDDLKHYRGEVGLSRSLHEGYGDFFSDEDLIKYFTVYSYANLNVTYEDSLKKIYEARVPEGSSHVFLASIQKLISEQDMADKERMKQILYDDLDILYPLINVQPLMNVNFTHQKVLQAILEYPYGGQPHPQARDYLDIITAERSVMEIDPQQLHSIWELEEHYLRIPQYLGTVTWFWKAVAKKDGRELEVVFCRLPGTEDVRFQIIQWEFNS